MRPRRLAVPFAPSTHRAALLALLFLPPSAAGQTAEGAYPDEGAPPAAIATPAAGSEGHARLAPRARAVALEGEITLDGRLDEPAWHRAPPITVFWQREPEEGRPATQRTEVRFLFDGRTLYVGARMYDELGAEGVTSRLVRRDADAQSDELRIRLDGYHGHLGETFFAVNPAGVRRDADAPGGSNLDFGWDPVWQARTHVDSLGWTAELAIPFAQLRFQSDQERLWGLQVERTVKRLNEEQRWSWWPRSEQGGPSRYGHLEGIEGRLAGTNRIELLPYAVSQLAVNGDVDTADPFQSRADPTYRAGADLKLLLSSSLTLNATFNPDFGQAEVDPAVVNLSAFETFFPEKREFFIEGSGLFGFGNFWCRFCSNVSSLGMLFTRRIGRRPGGAFLAHEAGDHASVPEATTILGAAKLAGRLNGGTSVGVLNALTAREHARVAGGPEGTTRVEVEPLSNYFVGRVKQDLADGDLQVGAIATSVVRDLGDPALARHMNRRAEGVGVDAEYWWGDRTYHLLFQAAATSISGSPEAILRAQTSSARYFQRPDRAGGEPGANGLFTRHLDPTLTSMRGWGLYGRVAKDAGNWLWEGMVNVRSPGFENNDIAFLTRTDYVWMNGNLARVWNAPTSWYRQASATVGGQQEYNWDGDLTGRQLHAHAYAELPFWWEVGGWAMWRPSTFDDRLTRGGPVVRRPEALFLSAFANTDSRRPWVLSVNPFHARNEEGGREWRLEATLRLRPWSNVAVTLGPTYGWLRTTDQFVTAVDDPTAEAFYGRRYLFADLEQRMLAMTTRLNITFSPGMSLELFAQPLVSANAFSRFKEFERPRGLAKAVYGEDRGTVRFEEDGSGRLYFVDPDGTGPAEEFSFRDRDFTLRSLRGNAVFRWEYAPGSTLFLVWTQDRSASEPLGDFALGRDLGAMFDAPGDHVVMLKLTYWLGL